MNKQTQFTMTALAVIVVALAVIMYSEQQGNEPGATTSNNGPSLIRDYSPATGNRDAKVTIVEFFDPACETCKVFHPIVKRMMSRNKGKIRGALIFCRKKAPIRYRKEANNRGIFLSLAIGIK